MERSLREERVDRFLPLIVLLAGAWAITPPFVLHFNADLKVEIVDHVVPGILMMVSADLAILHVLRGETWLTFAGVLVGLCGFWMTATHVPLIGQASQGIVPMPVAIYHFSPGVVALLLGILWVWLHGRRVDTT